MNHLLRRSIAGMVVVTYVAGCTHAPSGQKAFDSFEQCITANLGLATVGGLAIGALGKALARQVTGDRGTQDRIAAAAGVGAAVMIGISAWKKCAAVYSRSEPVLQTVALTPPAAAPAQRRRGVLFERLDVRVEGSENDPPVPEFDFVYTADDPAAKDIKAVFRHKVEIVRFKTGDNDELVLTDPSGEALKDSSGRPIPLANATRMPRERLSWVTIAEEGRDDYVEDVVIQQGGRSTFRHRLQVPPRAQLPIPLPVPMRYTVTVEVEGSRAARSVDFALLTTGERPRRFAAGGASAPSENAAPAPASVTTSASAPAVASSPARTADAKQASNAFEATHTARRGVPLYDHVNLPRKPIARVIRGQHVSVDEKREVQTNNGAVQWVKVVTDDGKAGWMPASDLSETK